MSYDIWLVEPDGRAVEFSEPHMVAGGTFALNGTPEAWINITWNYARHFYRVVDEEQGIRWLYGKVAGDTVPRLREAIDALSDDTSDNYWEPTEGNAKRALRGLVILAERRPDAIWEGD